MADVFVHITHPKIEALGGPVPKRNLPYYEKKGWKEATTEQVEVHTDQLEQRAADAANLTAEQVDSIKKRADLDQLARDRGFDPSVYDSNQSLADAIKATFT